VKTITYKLLYLSLLATLALALGGAPMAGAQAPQQSATAACQNAPIPGSITGTVRNSDGNPLPGVRVTAHATTGAAPVVGETNAVGQYAITLLPGSYRLEFTWAGGPGSDHLVQERHLAARRDRGGGEGRQGHRRPRCHAAGRRAVQRRAA
jgi:hypothetical protein